jgi:hypothetical protein
VWADGFPSNADDAPKTNVAGGRRAARVCEDLVLQPFSGSTLTTADYPILLSHIPETWQNHYGFLNVTDEEGTQLYQDILFLKQDNFVLPPQVPPLPVGKSYHWVLALICNRDTNILSPDDPFVSGTVQRIISTSEPLQPLKSEGLNSENLSPENSKPENSKPENSRPENSRPENLNPENSTPETSAPKN